MKQKRKQKVDQPRDERFAPLAAVILLVLLTLLSWPRHPSGEPLGWVLLMLVGCIALRFLWAWVRGVLTSALIWIYGLVFAVCVLVVTLIYRS